MRSFLLACLLAPSITFGTAIESVKISGEKQFSESLKIPAFLKDGKLLEKPKISPLGLSESPGKLLGRVKLPELLDRHRDIIVRPLGSLVWNISVAGDNAFKKYFLTFARTSQLVITPLGDLKRLRGEGIDVAIVPGTIYNFRVSANIFDPTRGSTLHMTPVKDTSGPSHKIITGIILDAVKAKSFVFNADGKEHWLLYGTDVDPNTNTLTNTRSLLFAHEDGLSSKAWPLSESALASDKPYTVSLGDTQIVLMRTSQGELLIHNPK